MKFYEERGLTVIASTPEEAAAHLESEQKEWQRGIKAENDTDCCANPV